MIEPSRSSTIEWTIDCGWMTTSIRPRRHAEQPVRLDHLEPLVHQRRRVDRDLAPHLPGRMAAARPRASPRRAARRRPAAKRSARRGQHEPPDVSRGHARAGTGGWRCARCRPAGSATPRRRAASVTSAPAITSTSLLASAIVLPRLDRRQHGLERRGPGRGAQHEVDVRVRRHADEALGPGARPPRPGRTRATWRPAPAPVAIGNGARTEAPRPAPPAGRRSPRRPGRRPAADRGCASTTASALCPIDPVDPRMAMRFTGEGRSARYRTKIVEHRRGEQQRVDPIEHAAVPGNQRRAVLHARAPLQHRLEQVAGNARRPRRPAPAAPESATGDRPAPATSGPRSAMPERAGRRSRRPRPPRLLRADGRRQRAGGRSSRPV